MSGGTDAEKRAFVQERCRLLGHSGLTLFDHLAGTERILSRWGARLALQDAGLFHSVYGTENFSSSALSEAGRNVVRALIGEEAETVVFTFCAMEQDAFYDAAATPPGLGPSRLGSRWSGVSLECSEPLLVDLCHLTAANALEQLPRMPDSFRISGCVRLATVASRLGLVGRLECAAFCK